MDDTSVLDSFSDDAKSLVASVAKAGADSIDDLIKAQEAADRSHKMHSVLLAWSTQQSQERQLRRMYALCFAVFLGLQILSLNVLFYCVGAGVLLFSDSAIRVFFVSVFGEITALVLIITKHLFPNNGETVLETLKNL